MRVGLILGLTSVVLGFSAGQAAASVTADFNGDGYGDLAIGAPFEDRDDEFAAGAVQLLFGSVDGLSGARGQFLTEDHRGIRAGGARQGNLFGHTLGWGDFDDDGRADLVVGVTGRSPGGNPANGAGVVRILYGSRDRLTMKGDQLFSQRTRRMKGDGPQWSDGFGASLAVGDFNGDGADDLAIGAPGEGLGPTSIYDDHGVVHVLYSNGRRLGIGGNQYLTKRRLSGTRPDHYEQLGGSLAAGDLNGDGSDDLAIGVLGEQVSGEHDRGAVRVVYGGSVGLDLRHDQRLTENTHGLAGPGVRDGGRHFGASLATGRLNGDRIDDLAIGSPAYSYRGAVRIIYGARPHLALDGSQYLTEATPGMAGPDSDPGDRFGASLSTGKLNADRFADLMVGVPHRVADYPSTPYVGAARVLFGARHHVTLGGDLYFDQATPGIEGDGVLEDDYFGSALTAADFDGDGAEDLAIGEPQKVNHWYDPRCGDNSGGGVHVLYSGANGPAIEDNQFFTQDTPGLGGHGAEPCEAFGLELNDRAAASFMG